MVSFSCDYCQEIIKKPKLDQHTRKCRNAQFSCVDCSVTFTGTSYKSHTSCVSEAEKYQKSVYKDVKKNKKAGNGDEKKGNTGLYAFSVAGSESIVDQIKKQEGDAKSCNSLQAVTETQEQPIKAKKESSGDLERIVAKVLKKHPDLSLVSLKSKVGKKIKDQQKENLSLSIDSLIEFKNGSINIKIHALE